VEWFYAKDGKRIGPLSESSLEQRLGSGEIDLDTWVWRRGMEDWAPLRVVRSAKVGGSPAFNAPPELKRQLCAECGARFPDDELVMIAGRRTCGACKSTVLQKLQEGLLHTDTDEATRTGKLIVVGRNGVLPPRCVKCNRPALEKPQHYRVFWAPPTGGFILLGGVAAAVLAGIYLGRPFPWLAPVIFFASALVAGAASSIRGQRVHIGFGICPEHARKRFVSGAVSAGVSICGLLILFLSGGASWILMLGAGVTISGVVLGFVRGNLVTTCKADKTHVWLKGGGSAFLESLPDWPGK
jgi:DNA-directed RNA polymerase subunit RPC12/RpoP